MGLRDFARSLVGGSDRALAETTYEGRESASDRTARLRREKHRARVNRDGDAAGRPFPRRLFRDDT